MASWECSLAVANRVILFMQMAFADVLPCFGLALQPPYQAIHLLPSTVERVCRQSCAHLRLQQHSAGSLSMQRHGSSLTWGPRHPNSRTVPASAAGTTTRNIFKAPSVPEHQLLHTCNLSNELPGLL